MPTISIVFRGLLVLNQHLANGKPCMEIGILEEKHHHFPRIMTFRNGVREETLLLDMDVAPVLWQLVVDDPVTTGTTLRQNGSFDRLAGTGAEDDFRWVINLENGEFPYGNIDQTFGLDRADLKHVVQITSGEFYTRLKSQPLRRSENGGVPADFGAIAGVIGCDIQVNSGAAKLIGEDPQQPIFTFNSAPNVLYEFANSPSDTDAQPADHFPHYYEIFKNQPPKKFGFERRPLGAGAGPGPNPALCGKIFLGEFGESLDSESNATAARTSGDTDAPHGHSHKECSAAN